MSILDIALPYLACPDDGGSLEISDSKLLCKSCKTSFRIINENTVELIAKNSFKMVSSDTVDSYSKYYSELREIGHPTNSKTRLWGLNSTSGFVDNLRKTISKIVGKKIVCDIGAGVGNYSLFLAQKSDFVFHCDLDMEALDVARQKAKKVNLKNIFFVRCDYLYLPFTSNSLPCLTCIDVLEKGREHDTKLIKQITNKSKDLVVIDFHSKERTKLNRAPDWDRRYSKKEIIEVLNDFNLKLLKIEGMGYLPTIRNFPQTIFNIGNLVSKAFFPPARWLVTACKNS